MRRSNARPSINPNSDSNRPMDPVKSPFRSVRPRFRSPKGKHHPNPRLRYCLYASFTIAFVLFCYVIFFGGRNHSGGVRYRVLIDGGSTGTRIHVFKYEIRVGKLVLFTENGLVSMKVNPGLSAHVMEPEMAAVAVAELVAFAKRNVPEERWRDTEVRLMATAGMRLLGNEDQERILNVCRKVLKASGFQFRDDWATVISGKGS